MPLVPAKCTKCGGELQIDSGTDAAICPYCGTPFIVEKAVNYYKSENHIHIEGPATIAAGGVWPGLNPENLRELM